MQEGQLWVYRVLEGALVGVYIEFVLGHRLPRKIVLIAGLLLERHVDHRGVKRRLND